MTQNTNPSRAERETNAVRVNAFDIAHIESLIDRHTPYRLLGINLKFRGDNTLAIVSAKGEDGYYVAFYEHRMLGHLFKRIATDGRTDSIDFKWDKWKNKQLDEEGSFG